MNLILRRIQQDETGTYGQLILDDNVLCWTFELPWCDNEPRKSCIPPGVYECVRHDSPKFPKTWEVTGVPGRSAILIHNGNTAKDTEGCILVGTRFLRNNDMMAYGVAHSIDALNQLRQRLPHKFTLTVENP